MIKRISYETHGSGEQQVVICNGLSQSKANWRGIARQYPQYTWILFDARGCGKSPLGQRPYSLDDHTDDLLWVLDEVGAHQPVIMGFSHGGRVAIRAVSKHPDRFSAVVLISVGSHNTTLREAHVKSWQKTLELGGIRAMAWASMPNIVGRKILEKYKDWELLVNGTANRNSEEGMRAMFEGLPSYPPVEDDARKIQMPALVMHGGEDPLVAARDNQELCRWMGAAQFVQFADCGHTLPLEDPARFMESLDTFIAKINSN